MCSQRKGALFCTPFYMRTQNEAGTLLPKPLQYLYWAIRHAERAQLDISESLLLLAAETGTQPQPQAAQIAEYGDNICEAQEAIRDCFILLLEPLAGDDPFPISSRSVEPVKSGSL